MRLCVSQVPRSLPDAFEKKPGWAKVKDRYWNMADVMGLNNRPRRAMHRSKSLGIETTTVRGPSCATEENAAARGTGGLDEAIGASLDTVVGDDLDSAPSSPLKPATLHHASSMPSTLSLGRKTSLDGG